MCKFATAYALSVSLIARQLPQRGSQGRLRRQVRTVLPSALADSSIPGLKKTKKIPISLWIFPEKSVILKCNFNEFWK